MYRDALAERRLRAEARRQDLLERARRELAVPYGRSLRERADERLRAVAVARIHEASLDELDALERAIDDAETALASFVAAAREDAERARPFARLGPPSPRAATFTDAGAAVGALASDLGWSRDLAECLSEAAARHTAELPEGALLDAGDDAVSLYFVDAVAGACRMTIVAIAAEEAIGYYASVTVSAVARPIPTRISVRPQTFGDDVLATLRIRRDPTFDHEEFDTLYFLAGDEAVLREIFTPEVRAVFVRVAREDPATVEVRHGIATLRLGYQRVASACAILACFQAPPGDAAPA